MTTAIMDTCTVTCEDNGQTLEAAVINFVPKSHIQTVIHQEIRLTLQWNGRVYLGNLGKRSFVSNGPIIKYY
jgi:hypothetical protein